MRTSIIFFFASLLASCSGGDSGGPDAGSDARSVPVGFNLVPSTIVLQPGECTGASLLWSGGTQLAAEEVEWDAPEALVISMPRAGFVYFCAGDALGDGDINVRLVGGDEFLFAGRGFVHQPPDRDFDTLEATHVHGVSPRPTRVFWSEDGSRFYVPSYADATMSEYDADTLARRSTHLIRSQDAVPMGDGRVAVAKFRQPATYHLDERAYGTWYDGFAFAPNLVRGSDLVLGAANGRTAAIAFDMRDNSCTNAVVDFRTSEHTLVSTQGGLGLVPETGAPRQPWVFGSGSGPIVERFMQISESGRYILYGPQSCWTSGTTLVDLEERTHHPGCVGNRPGVFWHRPVFSRDESTIVSAVGSSENQFEVVNLSDCSPRGRIPVPGLGHVGFDVSADGTEMAVITTGLQDETLRTSEVWVVRVPTTAESLAAGTAGTTTEIGAHYLAHPDEQYFKHRIAYSPSGDRLAIAFEDGQVGVMDLATSEVRMNDRILWHTAQPTPVPDLVLADLEGPVATPLGLVSLTTGRVIREHSTLHRLTGVLEEGYVLFHEGSLESVLIDYATGEETPYTGRIEDEALDFGNVETSEDGTTCAFMGSGPGNLRQLCVDGACASVSDLTEGDVLAGAVCLARDGGSALFLGQVNVWSWNGRTPLATHWSEAPGGSDEVSRMFRVSNTSVFLRTRTHLMHWEL